MFRFVLLQAQVVTDTLKNMVSSGASVPIEKAQEAMSFIDIITSKGLLVMLVPIVILSIISIFVFFERYFFIRQYARTDKNFMNDIHDLIHDGKIDNALMLCKSTYKPIARMIEKGISRIGKPIKEIEDSIEIAGKFEIYNLEKNVHLLAVIAGIAPMFGFLGTIIGVIKIFYDISLVSDVSIGSVSAGLYVKMISSAAGLFAGILAYIFYHWLNMMISKIVHQLEWSAMNFIDLLEEPIK